MGNIFSICQGTEAPVQSTKQSKPPVATTVSKVTEVDVVKSKLKKTRDYIQNFIDNK